MPISVFKSEHQEKLRKFDTDGGGKLDADEVVAAFVALQKSVEAGECFLFDMCCNSVKLIFSICIVVHSAKSMCVLVCCSLVVFASGSASLQSDYLYQPHTIHQSSCLAHFSC